MDQLQSLKSINNKGIGLVETLLAVVFAVTLLVSLVTLANFNVRTALQNTESQRSVSSANKLIEDLRVIKDSNFVDFKSKVISNNCQNSFCYLNGANITQGEPAVDNTGSPVSTFKVVIPDSPENPDEIIINIITRWKISNKDFSSPVSTVFTNWRSRP